MKAAMMRQMDMQSFREKERPAAGEEGLAPAPRAGAFQLGDGCVLTLSPVKQR